MPGQLALNTGRQQALTLAGLFGANQIAQLVQHAQQTYDRYSPRIRQAKKAFDEHYAKRKQITESKGSSMPRYPRSRGRPSRKSAKRGTAKRRRQTQKTFKRAKKNRNYRYLSKVPIPLGGLTERKVIRLIGADSIMLNNSTEAINPGTTEPVPGLGAIVPLTWRTFCLNDLYRWRTYLFRTDEAGSSPANPAGDGYVPGWDLWKDRYSTYEVIGAKVKLMFINNAADAHGNCLVGYNITHDRRQNKSGATGTAKPSDADTLHDRCEALEDGYKLLIAEDVMRSKLFTTKTIIAEAPGNTAYMKTGFNVKTAYPRGANNDYSTSAVLADSLPGPGRPGNRTYMTLLCAPTLSGTNMKVEVKVEVEWIVVLSDLKEQFKTTQQNVQDSFRYEAGDPSP